MEEFILKRLKRKTQIIYPKDLGNILIGGNVFPGARVLESGIGSGSATITLLRFLGRKGKLISYEQRPDFIELTRKTIEDFQGLYGKFEATHEIKTRDVYEGIEEEDLDTILLDVPEPERVVDSAAVALRPNGVLLCWLPTALQIHTLVRALKLSKMWAQVETTETIVRPWHVGPKSVRPELQMVAHTGFLTVGRRIVHLDAESD
jgi:tRNA (adenine57-N1/adenine58-N1)-methyltransferase